VPAGRVVSDDKVKAGLYKRLSALQRLLRYPFSKLDLLQDEDFCAMSSYRDGNDFVLTCWLSTNCFLRWRIGKRNASCILFLVFLSLFVMYLSAVQQINYIMDQVERVLFFFFFVV